MSNPHPKPPPVEGQFKKGKSGNPAGSKPGKSIRTLLREIANAEKLAVIKKMVGLAKAGNVRAAEWVARYSDDPSAANIEIATREFSIKIGIPDTAEEGDGVD
jgi:hypothetical protein